MSDATSNEEVAVHDEAVVSVVAEAVAETPVAVTEVEETPAVETEVEETPVVAETPVVETVATVDPVVPAPASKPVIKAGATKFKEAVVVESDSRNNPRKVREGIVISDKMDQTLVVAIVERVSHARYGKTVQRTKKLYVHDGENDAKVGDRVRVQETRPLSKLKRWRLTEVVERAR